MAFPDVRIVGEEGDLGAVDPEDEAVMKELASIRPDLSCLHNKWKDAADLLLPAKDLCVWIDPLDGTREFTEGRFNYVSTLGTS
jgi:3'(2'), 5'-bisphosphate nucleotidase